MEILYKACDGEIFDTANECEAHENLLEMRGVKAFFANSAGETISLDDVIEDRDNIEDIVFIKYFSKDDYNKVCKLFDYYGITCPEDYAEDYSEPHCWYWDESIHYGGWVNLYERLGELERIKEIFDNFEKRG